MGRLAAARDHTGGLQGEVEPPSELPREEWPMLCRWRWLTSSLRRWCSMMFSFRRLCQDCRICGPGAAVVATGDGENRLSESPKELVDAALLPVCTEATLAVSIELALSAAGCLKAAEGSRVGDPGTAGVPASFAEPTEGLGCSGGRWSVPLPISRVLRIRSTRFMSFPNMPSASSRLPSIMWPRSSILRSMLLLSSSKVLCKDVMKSASQAFRSCRSSKSSACSRPARSSQALRLRRNSSSSAYMRCACSRKDMALLLSCCCSFSLVLALLRPSSIAEMRFSKLPGLAVAEEPSAGMPGCCRGCCCGC
mmetsp:Transcript_21163/g.66957  ORF Transcript_21163/g.66957 Transcript_21163/m.66957 type:complete len:309 (+) Transcript_21163:147-1073(+)